MPDRRRSHPATIALTATFGVVAGPFVLLYAALVGSVAVALGGVALMLGCAAIIWRIVQTQRQRVSDTAETAS